MGRPNPVSTQGELWSERAGDWAELQEPQHRPKYEDAIRRIGLSPGKAVLDLGCVSMSPTSNWPSGTRSRASSTSPGAASMPVTLAPASAARRQKTPAPHQARTSGDEAVKEALTNTLAPYRTNTGGYRIGAEYRYLSAVVKPEEG